MRIEVALDVKTVLGEGPLWDVDHQRLYFVDIAGQRVFRCTASGGEVRAWDLPEPVGAIAIRKDGSGAICAMASGFHALDFATGETVPIHDPEPDLPGNRLNDGKTDRAGRFLAGSMNMAEKDRSGSLWRLDPDMTVHRLETGITVSNGPCFAPDGRTFYFADSWVPEIRAYDYDPETGSISGRRVLAATDRETGVNPDGATVDAEGYLWSARVYAGTIVRHAPDGSVDRVIPMPVRKVTSVMFGGPDLDTLYVTSMARPPLPGLPGDGPLRGAVFAITGLGVRGLPETRFGA